MLITALCLMMMSFSFTITDFKVTNTTCRYDNISLYKKWIENHHITYYFNIHINEITSNKSLILHRVGYKDQYEMSMELLNHTMNCYLLQKPYADEKLSLYYPPVCDKLCYFGMSMVIIFIGMMFDFMIKFNLNF